MNPYPLVALNHFTVPVATSYSLLETARRQLRSAARQIARKTRRRTSVGGHRLQVSSFGAAVRDTNQRRTDDTSTPVTGRLTPQPPSMHGQPLPVTLPV